jgi:ABC-2 type transport system ATP-binding protein
MSAAIETEQLTKNYGRNPGIRHVDLTVDEGEVFGFLGPNGVLKASDRREAAC